MKSTLRTFIFYASFMLVLASYMPFVFKSPNLYASIKIVYFVLFGLLFLVTFNIKGIFNEKIILIFLLTIVFIVAEILVCLTLNLNIDFKDFFLLSIPFLALLIGYNIKISSDNYLTFFILYCSVVVILAVSSIIYYVGSFTILDQYKVDHKNSLGAILANSVGILFSMIATKSLNGQRKIILIIYSLIICSCIIVMRSRASFLGLLSCIMIIIWLNVKGKGYWLFFFSGIFFIVFFLASYGFIGMPPFIEDFFVGAYDVNDLNNLSSGRWDRNVAAVKFISNFPLFGNLSASQHIPQIHNYVLIKAYQYGLLGSLPLLFLYFYLIGVVIKNVINIKKFGPEHYGFLILIIPLIISLFEYSFPYGPGSVQVIVFFMFGYSLKQSKQSKQLK